MPAHHGKFVSYYRVSTDRQGPLLPGLDAQKEAVQQRLDGGRWQSRSSSRSSQASGASVLNSMWREVGAQVLPRRLIPNQPRCPQPATTMFLAVLTQPRSAGQKPAGRQIFTRFRLNRSAGRACATDAQAITTEVGGHVESLCCRSCCFRSFCRVLQPTQYLACALFDVDVDGTSLRLPLSLYGSRSQPSPYEFCLGCK